MTLFQIECHINLFRCIISRWASWNCLFFKFPILKGKQGRITFSLLPCSCAFDKILSYLTSLKLKEPFICDFEFATFSFLSIFEFWKLMSNVYLPLDGADCSKNIQKENLDSKLLSANLPQVKWARAKFICARFCN